MSINFPLQDSDREKLKATDHASEHKTEQSERKLAPTPVAPNHTVRDVLGKFRSDDNLSEDVAIKDMVFDETVAALKQLIEEAVIGQDDVISGKYPVSDDARYQVACLNALRATQRQAINTLFGKGE